MKIIKYFDSELSQRFLQQSFVSRIDITDLVNRVIPDFTHPETLEGEIHPGNTSREFDEDIKWKSKRIGRTALDYKGEEIVHPDESYPYFVSREEVEAAGYEVKEYGI